MLSTVFPIVSSISSTTERSSKERSFQKQKTIQKAPKALSQHHSPPLFLLAVVPAERRPLKAACFLNRTISVQAKPFMPVFYRSGKLHAFFPCIYQSFWSDAAFWGGVSELEGHLPVLSGILWSDGRSGGCVSALGRPLASAGWEGVALAALPDPDQQLHNA